MTQPLPDQVSMVDRLELLSWDTLNLAQDLRFAASMKPEFRPGAIEAASKAAYAIHGAVQEAYREAVDREPPMVCECGHSEEEHVMRNGHCPLRLGVFTPVETDEEER